MAGNTQGQFGRQKAHTGNAKCRRMRAREAAPDSHQRLSFVQTSGRRDTQGRRALSPDELQKKMRAAAALA